jgi:hypothetical protein
MKYDIEQLRGPFQNILVGRKFTIDAHGEEGGMVKNPPCKFKKKTC